jgi:hypothetical protein
LNLILQHFKDQIQAVEPSVIQGLVIEFVYEIS